MQPVPSLYMLHEHETKVQLEALTAGELFGFINHATQEWKDNK